MSTNHTTNYDLNQWEGTDKVLRTEFNADNAKIDAALKANADAIETLEGQITALQTDKGNCIFYTTSYVGTGVHGANNCISLTFPAKPYLVVISAPDGAMTVMGRAAPMTLTVYYPNYTHQISMTWEDRKITWYSVAGGAYGQQNESGKTYHVLALLAADE